MEGTYTPSVADIASINRGYGYGDGFGFGGSGLWLFAILALMNGGWGYGRGYGVDGRVATVEDLNNSANFTRLESQVRANENLIQAGLTNLGNGICSLGYQLATDKGELSKQLADCCCTTQRAIDSVKFDMANYSAATNATITAQVQSIKDMLSAEKAAALQAQVNKLEMEKMFCGVPRFQPATVYGASPVSFSWGSNGCCGY